MRAGFFDSVHEASLAFPSRNSSTRSYKSDSSGTPVPHGSALSLGAAVFACQKALLMLTVLAGGVMIGAPRSRRTSLKYTSHLPVARTRRSFLEARNAAWNRRSSLVCCSVGGGVGGDVLNVLDRHGAAGVNDAGTG